MKWTFENFKPKLQNLTPEVREKVLEIAHEIMETGSVSEEKAISPRCASHRVAKTHAFSMLSRGEWPDSSRGAQKIAGRHEMI